MKIGKHTVQVFKIKNRRGYAAVASGCLTEGASEGQALERMKKALNRIEKKK